ncbi:MAG: bifunctional glutamate N-acetyltransferase/amino-acid acetyltransferase ArgJ [Proteobacteria bacterium]|nr:bifunctional glutamate N-acetyltransferase/amino-acid acetyltransferase ArgJ [Pseudomonadota bacterium]
MNKDIPPDFKVPGFVAAGISAGIKKNREKDLALIYSAVPSVAAGVFTTNRVKAAPVLLSMERIKAGRARAILINSGSANACTGKQGLTDGRRLSRLIASSLKTSPGNVLLASTGVIGKPLPMHLIEENLPCLLSSLTPDGLGDAARAIVTTDTFPKAVILRQQVNGREITLAGIAKGAGMISPQMATLLSFVVTDASISLKALRQSLKEGVQESFNRVIVDGDMSTNDTLLILANGEARNREIIFGTPGYKKFAFFLHELLFSLAQKIASDGEGATKLVAIAVEGARTASEAERVARAVATSPLVKTAFFGEDANWGRILCATGYSGAPIDPNKIDVYFDNVAIVRRGQGAGPATEEQATAVMKKKEYTVRINLNRGKKKTSFFTTDFSLDYVKINASYRS